jgi:hypothetical protein
MDLKDVFYKVLHIFIACCCLVSVSGCGGETANVSTDKQTGSREQIVITPVQNVSLSTKNGDILQDCSNALRTQAYIALDEIEFITINEASCFKVFAYGYSENDSYEYLGCTNWISDNISKGDIYEEFPGAAYVRVEIINNTKRTQTADTVSDSEIKFLTNNKEFSYNIGTIFAADGTQDLERNTRYFMENYLSLNDYTEIALNKDYVITWFAYSYDGEAYNYLGTSDWLSSGFFTCDSIKNDFPTATHFRFAVRCLKDEFELTDSSELEEVVRSSEIGIFNDVYIPEFELGEIYESNETAGKNNDENICSINDSIAYDEYMDLETISEVSVVEGLQMAYYAFDENKNYLGYWGWYGAQIDFYTSEVTDKFSNARYIKLAVRTKSGDDLQYQEDLVSFYSGTEGITKFAYYRDTRGVFGQLTCTEITKLKVLQDGAIYNGTALCMAANQKGVLYSIDSWDQIATVTLNGNLNVHCNSVCFGKNKYDNTDDFPLLYCNVYNSYSGQVDRKEGTCGVYRLVKQENDYIGQLIQVIEISFIDDLSLWKSKDNNEDIRPYGNFAVDFDSNQLYVLVPRDADDSTRYFSFRLPSVDDGVLSDEYGVNTVKLSADDISSQFDERYMYYPQGTAYYNGKLLVLEGMENNNCLTKLTIIDLNKQKVCATVDLDDMGITSEPEMVAVDEEIIYITDIDGRLYSIEVDSWD